MFTALLALGVATGTIYKIGLPETDVEPVTEDASPAPDGVVVDAGRGMVYWTTMGRPQADPSLPGGKDFTAKNGGVHAVSINGGERRDIVPAGAITTGKQLAFDGVSSLYFGDREGMKISTVSVDGTGLTDLIVNTGDDIATEECIGVAVDTANGYLYWTQKGAVKGGQGRIFRAGLSMPQGESADARSDIEVLWEGLPEPIDLDLVGDQLYWTDRGAGPDGNSLNRAPVPAAGKKGAAPEILARGFAEAIGLAVDAEAAVAYVSDLSGKIYAIDLSAPVPAVPRVLVELKDRITGLAGVK